MARLFSSGFELNSSTAGVEFTTTSGTVSIQTTTVRSGTYALQISSLASATAEYLRYVYSSGSTGPFYFRVYLRVDTLPSAENRIIENNFGIFWVTLDNTGALRLYDEDGAIGSASSVLSTGIWYRIELEYNRISAAGSHILTARINGTEFAGSATRNLSSNVNAFIVGGNLNAEAQTTGNWYFDDIAINDNTGGYQNSWPGEGSIVHLRPSAVGDNDAWDLTTTFEDIDEVTPDDATTIISSLTSGDLHDVNIDATPAALGYADKISVVHVGVRFNESIGTDPDPTFVCRIKDNTNGTVEEGSTITASSTSYGTNTPASATPANYTLTLYNLPGSDNQPWSKYALDSAQIGVRLTNSPVGLAQVSTLWALVEYQSDTNKTPHNYGRYIQVGQGMSRSEAAK